MANIKNLQMCYAICCDARVSVKKTMFGLRSTAVYNPTGSIIDARVLEYSQADGEQLLRILCAPRKEIIQAIGSFRPVPISNGNYLAEVCTSRDGAFLAVRLYKFCQLNYDITTDVLFFEGDDARSVAKMF